VTARWPDGSTVAEDPHAAAARLDAECLGWRVWYGNATGHFFAVRVGARVMVEAKTTSDLIGKINRHQAADPAQNVGDAFPRVVVAEGAGRPGPTHSGPERPSGN
jgi:hypothetical protein